ncbi:hypothetical protein OESDEN_03077 [Oesophagostomum dentatum]|uniref:MADF domain-containing protein n=1 Tax=Oesophagostomum dentatum TaxID=61180 RepID=A0A0B1THB4_OESDE|nr:hypothetical protein OESDEN_03077 [Oesophagostomum dentatum]
MQDYNSPGYLSETEKLALIETVAKYPVLWNSRDIYHKSLHARASAWKAVAEEMKIRFGKKFEAKDLRRNFKNLRDVYVKKRRDYKEALRRASGADKVTTLERYSSWTYFKPLSYLESCPDTDSLPYSGAAANEEPESSPMDEEVVPACINSPDSVPIKSDSQSVPFSGPISSSRKKRLMKSFGAMEDLAVVLKNVYGSSDKYDAIGRRRTSTT